MLTTARLSLRPITAGDADAMMNVNADPEVMRYLTGGRAPSRDDVNATIARSIGNRWVATLRHSDEVIGWFGIAANAPGERELGYRLARACWGQGLATEGARCVIDHAFTTTDVARVWAQTMFVNNASRRVMEKCGLRFVRTFLVDWPDPIDGSEHGDVEYELTRADWLAMRR